MDARIGENVAAAVVREHLAGASVRRRDLPGAPPGTPDFEITLPWGTVPLEVTRATNGGSLAFWRAVNGPWHIGSERLWILTTREGVDVRRLRASAESVIPQLEAAGIHEFDVSSQWDAGDASPPTWTRLAVAGVREARSLAGEGAGTAMVTVRTTGVSPPEVINGLVEELLGRLDNTRKVGATGHLFLWVGVAAGRDWMAMDPGFLPDQAPSILAGPTVWVGRQHALGRHRPSRLWRYQGAWESLT